MNSHLHGHLLLVLITCITKHVTCQQSLDALLTKTLNAHGDRLADLEVKYGRVSTENQALQNAVDALTAENAALKANIETIGNRSLSCCSARATTPNSGVWSMTPTTLPASTTSDNAICRDNGAYDCRTVKDVVCVDRTLKYNCNKTCNVCDCRDVLQCSSSTAQQSFCGDKSLALSYCQRTCNLCALSGTPVSYNSCNDPVHSDHICPSLQIQIGICSDPDLVQICPNYCSGKCGSVDSMGLNVIGRSIKSRSEVLAVVANILTSQ